MRIVVAHNFYQQPGGEDQVFADEVALLRRFGHEVVPFTIHNDRIETMGRLSVAAATVWNRATYRDLAPLVRGHRPQVVHFHNTFPLISPAAYQAARDEGAAVVQTLHNFRLLCPSGVLFRDGKVCEDCVGRVVPWPGVVHKCYRGSRPATAVLAAALSAHRARGTYRDAVDLYIAPTESARATFVAGGLPAEKIAVKPNFVDPDPGLGDGLGGYAVFVGRLSYEKGLETLLEAWRMLPGVPLKVIGDGPLAPQVREAAAANPSITWLGRRTLNDVYETVGRASFLVFPSRCYETFGRVAVEAFAKGTPVIASGHGGMADVVTHGRTGLLFAPGDAAALADAVRQMLRLAPPMRLAARREYETKYTGDQNHDLLQSAYQRACESVSPRGTGFQPARAAL
jgi:glycosyltransferase involved in cell wall biosynthesis